MNLAAFLFYLFASLGILSALMVIRSENPVHSVLFLILTFFNAAGLLLLLEVEFLAMVFVVVYVGAIAVLFLFVVMMLDIKIHRQSEDFFRYLPIGGLIGIVFLLEIFLVLNGDYIPLVQGEMYGSSYIQWTERVDFLSNIEVIGQLLYTFYFYYFLVASLILLVAMVGAIVLTMQTNHTIRRQQIYQQVSRSFERAIFLISEKDKIEQSTLESAPGGGCYK